MRKLSLLWQKPILQNEHGTINHFLIMSIRIEHRFIKRLLPEADTKTINYIVVGTFNPAPPIVHLLTIQERIAFAKIENSKSYTRLSQVKNFYDRPQNRFWKVMDLIHNASFYTTGNFKAKNADGLKHYKGMDRDKLF